MIDDHSVPGPLLAILEDWSKSNPLHTTRLARFHEHLKTYVKSKGRIHILAIGLPSIGKAFDKALSSGVFVPCDYPFGNQPFGFRKRGRSSGIEPLLEIFFYVGRKGFHLRSNIDPSDVFFMRTVLFSYKKVELECANEVKEANINEFFEVDSSLSSRDEVFDNIIRDVSKYFVPLRYPGNPDGYSVGDLGWEPRHGPGATVDTDRSRDKFSALRNYPASLHCIFPPSLYALHNESLEVDHFVDSREIPAKVSTVPKTLDKTRVITVESTAKQFFQQAVRTFLLENGTKHYRRSIDISNQDLSKGAAKLASIDGKTATVDLKSASDYLSLETVSTIFDCNPPLLDALLCTRSDTALHPCGMPVYLKKYAGQGNATTFVVQSICYTVLCVAAFLLSNNLRCNSRNVSKATKYIRVYGDDIILPSSCMHHLSLILQCEGLRINTEKTHTDGFFREACGGDYFHGYDVTPLYFSSFDVKFKKSPKEEPELLQSMCEISNNAYRKGLWTCADYIRRSLPEYTHVYNFPGSLGFVSHLKYHSGLRARVNRELQVKEYLIYSLGSKKKFRESESPFGRLYKYFVEKPSQDDCWEGRLTARNTLVVTPAWVGIYHPKANNPHGL